MSKFIITRGRNGEYQFALKAQNGEIILMSERYVSLEACRNGISSVKINANNDNRYQRKSSYSGGYYFTLLAGNGQIIGTSEMYTNQNSRENAISEVHKLAPNAQIIESF